MAQVAPAAQDPVYPPPAYNPPPPVAPAANTTVVVTTQAGSGAAEPGRTAKYGEFPVLVVCQHCQATVTTMTRYAVGQYTLVIALICILVGFWLGCCVIPFFVNSCKDVIHECPNCQKLTGRYFKKL